MSAAWSSSRIRIASLVAVVVAALLGAAPPAHAFFCFSFSVGGPRVSFGSGPRYFGPRPAYAPYGYYGHPGWRPAPYVYPPPVWRTMPPPQRMSPYPMAWRYPPPR